MATEEFAPKPNVENVLRAFKALDRIATERGFLQYYLGMIIKLIKKATFCKTSEIPEILVGQLWETNNDLMMNSDSNIPYFFVNEECLKALNKVIKAAKKIETESYAEVIDTRSKLKGKEEYISKIEHDLGNLRMLNQSNLFDQYQKIIEENANLIKDKNILVYKFEDI